MRLAAALLLAAGAACAGEPPVTQDEAIAFHTNGLCQMVEPGKGLTRADGDGWIVSSLPGAHRLYAPGARVSRLMVDFAPGVPERIQVVPAGSPLYWCPAFKPAGRDACGPVPTAFLYDVKKVGDAR